MQESDKISFIAEYKQKLYLDNFYKEITIDFEDYFNYSGKIEKGNISAILYQGEFHYTLSITSKNE